MSKVTEKPAGFSPERSAKTKCKTNDLSRENVESEERFATARHSSNRGSRCAASGVSTKNRITAIRHAPKINFGQLNIANLMDLPAREIDDVVQAAVEGRV